MQRLLYLSLFLLLIFDIQGQERDTIVTRKLYYLQHDYKSGLDSSIIWSNKLNDYLIYSRLEMGNRMNQGIKYSKLANKQFWSGLTLIGLGGVCYISASYSDPIAYIENHPKYTRQYFNDTKRRRNRDVIVGSVLSVGGAYLLWRSHKNNIKSRWAISPDGIKYNISSK
jgi:hypothetical protein